MMCQEMLKWKKNIYELQDVTVTLLSQREEI